MNFALTASPSCVIAEMFKKKPIFPGTSDVDQAQKIFLCVMPSPALAPCP